MKDFVKRIPVLGPFAKAVFNLLRGGKNTFPGSKNYWENRYQEGGGSGAGSYEKLAMFKAEVLNNFVKVNSIEMVIEYGCGDGNQLKFSKYPSYLGFDVSEKAVEICESLFQKDKHKKFRLLKEYEGETAEVTMSLDVIYHLIEDEVFSSYMERLFNSSTKYVIIYSSNSDGSQYEEAPHVKHREFTTWIRNNRPQWELVQHLNNKFPYIRGDNVNGSFADFYIFSK